jgi:hypothetical protein
MRKFLQRVKAARTGRRRGFEAQNAIVGVLVSPASGEFVQLAFEVGHKHRFVSRKAESGR